MRFELTDNLLTLFFEGELNSYNADVMEKEIDEVLSSSKFQTLNLDFAKLNYISSAGLRIMLITMQRMEAQGEMIVKNVCPEVMDVFEITGFIEDLTIENE